MLDLKNIFTKSTAHRVEEEHPRPSLERFKFRVNQKIYLKPVGGPAGVTYLSSIQDVSENHIYVSLPIVRGDYILARTGELFDVTLYDPTGMYSFTVVVANRLTRPIPMLALEKPAQVKRFQQREFPRARAYLDVLYRPLSLPTGGAVETPKESVWTKDISMGGICMVVDRQLPQGLNVALRIDFPGIAAPAVNCRGQIKRVVRDPLVDTFLAGLEFTKISSEDQQQINKFVIASERM
jgi:c-di-GMP-binding flagellar brake protein YcgR